MTPVIIAILMAFGMPDYSIETTSNASNVNETTTTAIIIEDHSGF